MNKSAMPSVSVVQSEPILISFQLYGTKCQEWNFKGVLSARTIKFFVTSLKVLNYFYKKYFKQFLIGFSSFSVCSLPILQIFFR